MRVVHWRRGPGTALVENREEAGVWACSWWKVMGGWCVCRDATALDSGRRDGPSEWLLGVQSISRLRGGLGVEDALPWPGEENVPANRANTQRFRGPVVRRRTRAWRRWKARSWKSRIVQDHVWCCRGPTLPNSGAFVFNNDSDWQPRPFPLQRPEPLTFSLGRGGRKGPFPANVRALASLLAPSKAPEMPLSE
jgi:hypothetical protein